jgi:ABC-type antimicrobial peptide transport system permease subunit
VVAIAVALAVPVALVASRVIASYLFEVAPGDPHVLAAAGATVVLSAVSAVLVPAWRSSRLDATTALRHE